MEVGVGTIAYITCFLHLYFLQETLKSIPKRYKVLVYPNRVENVGSFTHPQLEIISGARGEVSVAAAWNILIEEILRKAKYALIINSDVILHPKAIENLVRFAEEHPEALLWTMAEWPDRRTIYKASLRDEYDEHPHFSAFMVDKRLFKEVGKFDSSFEMGYMEDLDMHLRILLRGEKALKTASALFYHFKSRTIACDLEVKARSDFYHAQNREYFKRKWGIDGWEKSANELAEILRKVP